ncbi:MAG: serine/threonine dehydratase [Holophagaceae bacterium]
MITRKDLESAAARVAPFVRRTPILEVEVPTPAGARKVALKLECLQHTGSFKPRGAFNSLLQLDGDRVIASSGGNHGLAVAYAARALGKRALIVVPATAARTKVEAIKACGAEVVQIGEAPAEALAEADRRVAQTGIPLVHPFDQAPTVAGQGSLGLELRGQAPGVRRWLVAVGGGGMPAGVALALEGHGEAVPVEPELCPTLYEAQRAGRPVPARAEGAARTSLGPPMLGAIPWAILKDRVGTTALVPEEAILDAQRWLWREVKLVAEPGGAVALAAVMSGRWVPRDDGPVGVVVCGGNADGLPG